MIVTLLYAIVLILLIVLLLGVRNILLRKIFGKRKENKESCSYTKLH
ncbi:MAG: hypothetical protein Q4G58_02170 [bacterium]|nr:hypothetical protein [bacterium]